jgi:hypothetical protein
MSQSGRDKKSLRIRMLSVGALGASVLFAPAAAATVSLLYSNLQMPDSLVASWLLRPLAVAGVVSVGSSVAIPLTITESETVGSVAPKPTPTPTPTSTPAASAVKPMKIGINLMEASYYATTRPFMNLLAADGWALNSPTLGQIPMPDDRLDANRNTILVKSGETARRMIARPQQTYLGKSVDIVCKWQGTGTVKLFVDRYAKNVLYGDRKVKFTWRSEGPATPWGMLEMTSVSATDPVRNMDCREADANPNTIYNPDYVAAIAKYNTVRFVKWNHVELNFTPTIDNRTKPGMASYVGQRDGVAIEYMIGIANEAKVNPWFNIHWKGSKEWVRKFAELVRDNLDPSLKVYVELSNEVWNSYYSVHAQARTEGVAAGLSTDSGVALLYRQAQKHAEVMDIWSDVFKGQEHRLVRVLGAQHVNPWVGSTMMAYKDTATKVDALATAPYLEFELDKVTVNLSDLSGIFTSLRSTLDARLTAAMQNKAVADKYGKRYITYEAGQSIYSSNATLNKAINRDPRMGQLYTRYLAFWQQYVGDLTNLYASVYNPTEFGAWGLQEYDNQPMTEAPKAMAVSRFLASIENKTGS